MRRSCRFLLACLAALSLLASALPAQWSVGVELGAAAFGGVTTDTSAADGIQTLRPYRTTMLLVRLERRFGRVAGALGLSCASPGIAVEEGDLAVVEKGFISMAEVAPELAVVVAALSPGVMLRGHLGLVVDVWSLTGAGSRTRAGPAAGLSLEWPLGGRFSGSLRLGLSRTGSVFDAGEEPAGWQRSATWRRSVAGGLRLGL